MKNYEFILLDIDGTLLDFEACEFDSLEKTFSSVGIPFNKDIYNNFHSINASLWARYEKKEIPKNEILDTRFAILFEKLGFEFDPLKTDAVYREYLAGAHVFEKGAPELLDYLKSKYRLYIVTNGTAANQVRRLKDSGIDKIAEGVFISEIIGCPKPQPEFFEAAAAKIEGFEKDKSIIIGDSLTSDMRGGNNFGIDTLWYNPKHLENTENVKITYETDSLDKIKLFL